MNFNINPMLPYPTIHGLRVPSGSSNAPSFSFLEDNRAGCYLPAPNTVAIVTDLAHRLTVTNQTVTIGQTDNTCDLDVHGNATLNGDVIVNGNIGVQSGSNVTIVTTSSNVMTQKEMVVCSNILPADNAVQYIGTSNLHFKEAWIDTLHVSENTLYLGDTPVLGTESDSVVIRADLDQSINVKTTGIGVTNFTSTKGVNVTVSGLNSVVDLQSSGSGGRVVMGATTEIAVNAPTTTIGSNLTVQGNLTVNGTQFMANVQTVEIKDNILIVNKGQTGSGVSAGYAGIRVDRGDAVDYDLVFNEVTDKFEIGPTGTLVPIATEAFVNNVISAIAAGAQLPVNFDTSNIISGTLPVARGGTGVTSATGEGSVVLQSNANITGLTLQGITKVINGGYLDFGSNTNHNNGKRIALCASGGEASNSMVYYGFGMSPNTLDYMIPSSNDKHTFSYATGTSGRINIASFDKNGLTLSGGIYGSAISSSVNSVESNVAASAAAVKAAYDGMLNAQNTAVSASNVANAALSKSGGTLTGALTGTSATFNTLSGNAISSSTSTASNVAASSAITKVAYDNAGVAQSIAVAATTVANAASNTAIFSSNVAISASNVANAALPKSGGTLTGAMLIPDGTAAAPAIAFGDDVGDNTGIYRAYENGFGVACGGTNALTIDMNKLISSNNVIIDGTLDVTSNLTMKTPIVSTSDNAIRHVYGNTGVFYRSDGSDMYILKTATGDPNGSWDTTRPFRLNYANGDIMIGQNLGLGIVTVPTERLQVNGNIKIDGQMYLNGTTDLNDASNLMISGIGPQEVLRISQPSKAGRSEHTMAITAGWGGYYNEIGLTWNARNYGNNQYLRHNNNNLGWAILNAAGSNSTINFMCLGAGLVGQEIPQGQYALPLQVTSNSIKTENISVNNGAYINFGNLATINKGKRIALWQDVNVPDDAFRYYGFGISGNTLDYMLPGSTAKHKFSYSSGDNTSNAMFEITSGWVKSMGRILCETDGAWNAPAIAFQGIGGTYDTGIYMNTDSAVDTNVGAQRTMQFGVDNNTRVIIHGDNTVGGNNASILQVGVYQGMANIVRSGNWSLSLQTIASSNGVNAPVTQYVISGAGNSTLGSHLWRDRNGADWMQLARDTPQLAVALGGSAGSPTYTFIGNWNTGMYQYGTNAVGFTTGGITRMVVSSNIFANGDVNANIYYFNGVNSTTGIAPNGTEGIGLVYGGVTRIVSTASYWAPSTTASGAISLGFTSRLWSQLYASSATIVTSDDRLKINESFIENAMTTINKLRPQVYDKYTKLEYVSDSNIKSKRESGLIAQEVFYDVPELRHLVEIPDTADSNVIYTTHVPSSADPKNDPSDYSVWGSNAAGIRYEGFIPYIIKALQELDARLTSSGL